MTPEQQHIIYLSLSVILGLAAIFSFLALFEGPRILERMTALSQLGLIGIAYLLVMSFGGRASYHVEPALILMVTSFIGPMMLAKFMLERKKRNEASS